ncbi:MBL fold metallo-hydrolase [Kitasatospora sp. NBC_00240]|uniref:MBL fold metallo-hydrolase n=1 Tax=Kitasatospora sp. NBC_00240 TaxID=2903567 RepID=UPI0022533519|nr:MBL fold metallo-hydrolase [Kitasatospora sp. NBC_00240]MCX5213606.1 MBL fold metallo-hydrolase [Kitasatospora sp. NBC_00240]
MKNKDEARERPGPGNLDVSWHAGWPSAKHDPAPEIQVHGYDDHTVILRQNKSVHYEAPFMFLLFGAERALLLDTGATEEERWFPLRSTVDGLMADWLERHPQALGSGRYELLVAHTHGHGDHVAGDGQFAGRPATTVVGREPAEVVEAFGLKDWPEGLGELDLGGRVLDLIPGPGHQAAGLVFHDRSTGLLFTGDSFYPGLLYVQDVAAYSATVDRLLAFCEVNPVTHILGCHIEMTTTPGEEYPRGTTYQPDEPPLQLTVGQLRTLRAVLDAAEGRPGLHPSDDFTVLIGG